MAAIEEEVKAQGQTLARHDERITTLEARSEKTEKTLEDILKDYAGRPTWAVTMWITISTSGFLMLLAAAVTHVLSSPK